MLLISVVILVSGMCLGHDGHGHGHKHNGGGLEPDAYFQEDDHHEDHRHWYTKESNEKLQESLQKAKLHSEMGTNKDNNEERLSKSAAQNSEDLHGHDKASHGHGCGGHSHSHGQAHSHGDHHYHHSHGDQHSHGGMPKGSSATETSSYASYAEKPNPKALSTRYVWLESIASTCLISAAPFFILFFVPLESNSAEQRPLLKILLSFASGGLLGDAFLHLIPHAISPHTHNAEASHSHSHSHSHGHDGETREHAHDHSADMVIGLWVLAGMVAFLIVEKFVRHVKGGHSHSHGHLSVKTEMQDGEAVSKTVAENNSEVRHRRKESKDDSRSKESADLADKADEIGDGSIKVSGYLNLAADFTHNFTDGLAIGASYLVSRNVGFITTLTILLHEVPHEIGDFAILVQSGCSKRKAMWLQLTTATGALAGTLCGLLAENIGNAASSGILPFTAGGFIYIATVSVIPELLEDANPKQSIKEVVALVVGVLLMVVIAMLE